MTDRVGWYHGDMKKKQPPADAAPDPWKEKLLETLKKERPSKRRWGFWFGIILLGFVALLAWWLFPRTSADLPPLITFDVLAPAGAEAPVRAVFEVSEDSAPVRGRQVVFKENRLPLPGEALSQTKVTLDEEPIARATLKPPADLRQVAFEANCAAGNRRASVRDQAFIYLRPANTDLLIVGIDALTLAAADDWKKVDAFDKTAAVADAFGALRAAEKLKFQVVYLAVDPAAPLVYQTMRRWVGLRMGPAPTVLPEGPILGRPEYPGAIESATAEVLGQLKEAFGGKHVALTKSAATAQRFQAAGWRTLLIGDGEAPAGVERLAGWGEAERALAK
jgi:hypothetical protein